MGSFAQRRRQHSAAPIACLVMLVVAVFGGHRAFFADMFGGGDKAPSPPASKKATPKPPASVSHNAALSRKIGTEEGAEATKELLKELDLVDIDSIGSDNVAAAEVLRSMVEEVLLDCDPEKEDCSTEALSNLVTQFYDSLGDSFADDVGSTLPDLDIDGDPISAMQVLRAAGGEDEKWQCDEMCLVTITDCPLLHGADNCPVKDVSVLEMKLHADEARVHELISQLARVKRADPGTRSANRMRVQWLKQLLEVHQKLDVPVSR